MSSLIDILKKESRIINEEFEIASKQGDGTPQEVSDFRENAVQDFISRYFPSSHVVSKGKITDLNGLQSNSIDCLVLNPAHPNLVDSKGKFRLIFADGCDVAIEVKPNLARSDEIKRALEQGISVKKVLRSKTALLMSGSKPKHIVDHSLRIPFYIFCLKAFDEATLLQKIKEYYKDNNTSIEDQIDGVVIINLGILKQIKHSELNVYGAPHPIGKNSGWYFEDWGESTLVGMLLNIEYSFSSFPSIAESIMKRVLTKVGKTNVKYLGACQ
jgi:hypothetical protein